MAFIQFALALIVTVALFVLQIITIRGLKKDTDKYCAMGFGPRDQSSSDQL